MIKYIFFSIILDDNLIAVEAILFLMLGRFPDLV